MGADLKLVSDFMNLWVDAVYMEGDNQHPRIWAEVIWFLMVNA